MADAVIVAAGRTPIGRARKGSLIDVRPDDMLAHVMKEVVGKSGIDAGDIEDVIVGCGFPHAEQGFNVGRVASLLAGFPETVPGTTVNRFCASSLQSIRMAYHAINADEGDCFVAAGVESITRIDPLAGAGVEGLNPTFLADDKPWDVYIAMGETAENVAEQYDVSREDMDRFAQLSQERAVESQKNGTFDREIVPYPKPDGTTVDTDDGPRPSSTLEKLASLQPAFREGGTVTPGNSCPMNDGAAAVVVMSEEKARAEGLTPLVRIKGSSVSGLAPEIMGVGPIDAVGKVLETTGMSMEDVDIMELNEAFAAQVIPVCNAFGVDPFSDKLNPHGGAIALGHPYGMTGARIMTTLINDLETEDKEVGLETMCVGGGQGMAMIVERVS